METPKEQQTKKAIPIAKKNSNIAFPVMTWGIRNHFQSIGVLVTLLVLATIYLTGNNNLRSSHDSHATHKNSGDSPSQCNLFSGKWVFDNSSHPLYSGKQCTYMSDEVACEKFGRKDLSYQNWRWQPHQCDLPRWGSFDRSDGIYKEVEILRSYKMALQTWSDWLDIHVNRNKTQLFFVSMSPTHSRKSEWSNERGGNCYNETKMITKEGYWGEGSDPKMMRLVEAAIEELGKRGLTVKMLNITQMSEYRKEAHPSIYRKQWELLTQRQISNPSSYADCNHWCLPGVPDNWNELLYTLLLPSSSSS